MRSSVFFTLALCAVVACALERTGARQLAADEFLDVLAPLPAAFVMAMAPWCGHCVAAKPAFEAIDVEKAGNVPTFLLDASTPEAADVRSALNVRGFPTFLFLEHGVVTDAYQGDRTAEAFEAYLRTKAPAKTSADAHETPSLHEETQHYSTNDSEPTPGETTSEL